MPSMKHEGLVELFRNRPELAAELVQGRLGQELPEWSEARVESGEFQELKPTEYRADLVVLLRNGKPCFAIVVEVQLRRNARKRKTWPHYLTGLRARLNCPTALLVIAPEEGVARWCAEPIEVGHPGFVLRPLVVGPGAVPYVVEAEEARREPELAVLSAMAHGKEKEGEEIVKAVLETAGELEEEKGRLYVDLALSSLGEASRRALEELMKSGRYEYQSEFARKYFAQGREEGLKEGEALALLEVLQARGLKVGEEQRRRIEACEKPSELKEWLRKAVRVQATEELFESQRTSKPSSRRERFTPVRAGRPGR